MKQYLNKRYYPNINTVLLFLAYALTLSVLASCGASKKKKTHKKKHTVTVSATEKDTTNVITDNPENYTTSAPSDTIEAIVSTALSYAGTRYKFGGTTRKGMDCSGLIYVAFKEHNHPLPRTSGAMATQGTLINKNEIRVGDLLFFKTNKKRNRINHVGLVVKVTNGNVQFIHATTSRGVLVSSLSEGYWNYAFVAARRILE